MKKIFLTFFFSIFLASASFANEVSYSPLVGVNVGVGQTKGKIVHPYGGNGGTERKIYKLNDNATIVPFGFHAGYEIYFTQTMAIVPKIYFNYSKQIHKLSSRTFVERNELKDYPIDFKSNQFNYGLDVNYAWDFATINNIHDFGLTAGIGYEFNNINDIQASDNAMKLNFDSISQNGLTYNAGLYYKYDKHHKIDFNFKYKTYLSTKESVYQSLFKYSVEPSYVGTLGYSYIF